MWFILSVAALIYLVYHYMNYYSYWKRRNVPSVRPVPLFGNFSLSMRYKRSFAEDIQEAYNAFPDKRYIGIHITERPVLIIKDFDLLKTIFVKEFDVFPHHQEIVPDGLDPLWNNNLVAMRGGKRWHDLRTALSPSFTGVKMKIMFPFIKECAAQMSKYIAKHGDGTLSVELKSFFTKYTNDVIATTAFGVTCNTLLDENNEFYKNCLQMINLRGFQGIKIFLYTALPSLMKMLNISFINKSAATFFNSTITESIKMRKENNIVRPDMIHLLLEAQAKESKNITNEDILAQAMIFLFGGFDTTSTLTCHVAYELALNPDVQEKLYEELSKNIGEENGNMTYESIMAMKYLDMVVSETLRKWPPFVATDRELDKPFVIEPKHSGEKPVYLQPNDVCWIPTHAIHMDPANFPHPEQFDPERFSEENKHHIKPYSYIPFGAGPRNCIASRYALLVGKVLIVELISKFRFVPVEKTQIPLQMGRRNFSSLSEDGVWLGIVPRN